MVDYLGETNLTATHPGQEQTITYNMDDHQLSVIRWEYGRHSRMINSISIVAFVQKDATNEILQAVKLKL